MRDVLLAAVLADPDDPAHRMVYADALASAGDPRGELIAVELALADARGDPAALRARRRALRSEHGDAWWPGLATRRVRTRGGLVDAIAIRADELDAALAVAAREPVRAIELCGAWPVEAIRRVPPVRELTARALGDAELRVLYEAPCGRTIEALDLGACPIAEFAPGDHLAACRRLSLAGTAVDALAWAHADELVELDLSHAVTGRDIGAILRAAPGVVTLRASGVDHLDEKSLAGLTALAHLEVVRTDVDRRELARMLPNVRIVADAPERAAIDLVGEELEIAVLDRVPLAWLDGAPRPLRTYHAQRDAVGSSRSAGEWGTVLLLLDAIASGAARVLTDTGCTLAASLLPRDNIVTATLTITGDAVELDLDQYID